jgi:Peptidase A4 family
MRRRHLFTTVLTVAAATCAIGAIGMTGVASAATSGTATAVNVPQPGGAIHKASEPGARAGLPTISLNWSGYAATAPKNSKFTNVSTTFVQPAITCPGVPNQWTSNWAGLDGFNNGTVEQDGTFAHCGGLLSTTPVYQAWYEMFPANSVIVFNVRPGDVISAAVSYKAGVFSLTISDLTSGKSATHTATCSSCARASAEWIVERPELCNNSGTQCFLTELANFGTTSMGGDTAQVAGGTVKGVSGFTKYQIFMVNPIKKGLISLDTVGPLQQAGRSFAVTWDRSGTIFPLT